MSRPRRPHRPRTEFADLPEPEPAVLQALRAEHAELTAQFKTTPSNALGVKIRNVEARIRLGGVLT